MKFIGWLDPVTKTRWFVREFSKKTARESMEFIRSLFQRGLSDRDMNWEINDEHWTSILEMKSIRHPLNRYGFDKRFRDKANNG